MEIEEDGVVFKHLELARFLYFQIVLRSSGQVRALPWASKSAFIGIAAIGLCSYSNASNSIAQARFDAFSYFMVGPGGGARSKIQGGHETGQK